ncbi:hypothetical protein [Bradyrhizobium zhanjiangense]|uniref:BA14K family protein n=1 Tax=Bradyrhizobium zhanjiangense TaxID=1325107 RepID=A0ABY0DG18_9BRAD|nr:hypothetical protein [Bradyrhizobium zhanjiangense]RXG90464.1 hypothetical protein EAS62_28270 [Bradyrhizobium zhanjiangense]
MLSKTLSTFAVAVTVAASSLAPSVAFAQFPPPPPMAPAGPPPMAPAGPPALAAPGPAAPGPSPRLGPAAGPRIDLAARGAGGGPAVVGARTTAVNIGGAGHRYGGEHGYGYGARAATYAGAYAAGAYAGYGYEGTRSSYYSSSECRYVYSRHRRYLVCD